MSIKERANRKLFYVVTFLEIPFEGIDDYVCVPNSWIILAVSNQKAVVAYPNNEDPLYTRDRVRRRERPKMEEWRFYMAFVKYKSENYKDAESWIVKRNQGPGGNLSEIIDIQPEPVLNKKLGLANQPVRPHSNSDKPQLTVKPNRSSRKPLPRLTIRRPFSQKPYKNLENKSLKLNGNAKAGIITDHTSTITPSGCSKQEKSIIITETQLIHNDQTVTSFASNDELNTEQSTQLEDIKKIQSANMSVQSTSSKLLAEQQPPPKLSAEQQPPPKLLAEEQPPPKLSAELQLLLQPHTDRQTSPKLSVEQNFSPKLPAEQQSSPGGQYYQPPLSVSVIEPNEFGEDIESCQNILQEPITKERPPTKTRRNTLELSTQFESVDEGSTPLVYHEHSIPETRDVSNGHSKEPKGSQNTHFHQIMTVPRTVLRPPNIAIPPFQQYEYAQSPMLPVSSHLNLKLQSQKNGGSNSIKVALNHQKPRFQGFKDSKPSNFYHETNCGKPFQMSNLITKKPSSAVNNLKNPVDKQTFIEGATNDITTMQYSPSSMMKISSLTSLAVMKTAPLAQNHLQQAQVDGSLENNVRCSIRDKFIDQTVSLPQVTMNTSAAANLSELANQYRSFIGASRGQQYLPTVENYLQQSAHVGDMFGRPTMAPAPDQRDYHQNTTINEGFALQSQPNPINQNIQFLPRKENQYIPVKSAYAQEVIRHELMRRPTDGVHTYYKPKVQNGANIQVASQNSLNQSHQYSEHLQQKYDSTNYRDPYTASTQNGPFLKQKSSCHHPSPHRVTKRPQSLFTSKALLDAQRSCLLEEPGLRGRVNQTSTKYNNMNLSAVSGNLTAEPEPTLQDSEVQTMPSSDRQHGTLFTLVQRNFEYQHSHTEKIMVDQATETESIMDIDHYIDDIVESPVGEGASEVVDRACQTDEWLREEQGSSYQETVSDFESTTEQEIESDDAVVSEVDEMNLKTVENLSQENQQKQSKILVEQDMLSVAGTLFTEMGASLWLMHDMFNQLRDSILVCTQTYKTLLEKIDKFKSIETTQIPTSLPNSVTSQGIQVPQ